MSKPILCIDFDGVLHSYTSGWQGADKVGDPPVPGAVQFLAAAVKDFTVAVYSSRSGQPGGIEAMRRWLGNAVREAFEPDKIMPPLWFGDIEWPTSKPSAFVTIDDRALTFTGVWPDMEVLRSFKPWNKREPLGAAVRRLGLAGD